MFARHPLPGAGAWEAVILELWRRAAHREERCAAVEPLLLRRYSGWLEPSRLPMIEEMVVTGAWRDYVDAHPELSTLSRREALKHLERQRQRRSAAGPPD